ncbi:MAG: hypothetical protein U0P82_02265 [Vicinamibacterales bacterium]
MRVLAEADVHVPVAEHATTGHEPLGSEPLVGFMHTLAGLFAVCFIRERLHGRQRLVERRLRHQRTTVHILDDVDAALCQLLDQEVGLVGFAAERLLLRHNQHVERRPMVTGSTQLLQTGAPIELSTRNAVIHVNVLVQHRPTASGGEGASIFHLPGYRLAFLASAGLLV